MDKSQKYWIAVAAKDHVMRGVSGSFMQANHGKEAPLKRISPGDWVLFYSPKQTLEETEKLQAFTAIGQASDNQIYQHEMSATFSPYRRNVTFFASQEVPIQSLLEDLDFIVNKKAWGYVFRFGFFEIGKADFELIRSRMCQK